MFLIGVFSAVTLNAVVDTVRLKSAALLVAFCSLNKFFLFLLPVLFVAQCLKTVVSDSLFSFTTVYPRKESPDLLLHQGCNQTAVYSTQNLD